ncbi:MAG: LD-carboxypeptidase [Lentisphaerae bacterium]|nr:LD-carboxypeptidase [Lentisphaerota bacterium]MCP4101837.1 LD-carboxypeptidase [Lentisphaerota bacterium]
MKNFLPDNIKHVAIIAPAGPVNPENLTSGAEILRKHGVNVTIMPNVLAGSRFSYLSSDVEGRLEDLHACWTDETIDLVFCARGGYGSAQLLPYINWDLLRSRRLPFIGYSDITALHAGMLTHGAGMPIAAPMPLRFQESLFDCKTADFTLKYLHSALDINSVNELKLHESMEPVAFIKDGVATALPFAANLAVLVTLCGTSWLPDLDDKILIVEDINEPAYKVDRYLTQLSQNGVLKKLGGLVFGSFTECGSADDLNKIMNKAAKEVSGPVVKNLPFGHTFPMVSINQNKTMTLDSTGNVITL